jgi:hypothetical protein
VPPEVAARLRADAPAGIAIVDGSAPPRALGAASPQLVLAVGGVDAIDDLGISPRTAIGAVALEGGLDGGETSRQNGASQHVDPDFVWQAAAGSDPWSELMAAWSGPR